MLAIPILFYYFNPQTNINEIIEPTSKIPETITTKSELPMIEILKKK
jgi:hypothetical protein